MKFSTFYLSLLLSLVLALSVSAAPNAKPSGTPSKPSPPPPISKCKKEPLCCVKETHTSAKEVGHLVGLLRAKYTGTEKNEGVGLTCKKMKITGVKKLECEHKPLCCDKFYNDGILALGCKKSTLH